MARLNTISTAHANESSFFGKNLTLRQKMTRRLLAVIIFLAAMAAVSIVVQQSPWQAATVEVSLPAEAEVLPVATITAQPLESYTRERSYTGLLRESRRSQLSFQRAGELKELTVDEGQVIVAGQTLGRLDGRHIRAQQSQLEAQVAEAKAILEELVAGPRQETIAAKRAELRAQQSQQKILAKQYARRKVLVKSESVSREEYETFLYDYEAAVARVDVVQRELDEMLAGTRTEKITVQRARLAQLDAQLTDLQIDWDDTKLVAPFSGRVAKRFVDEGTVVEAGTPTLEIIDDTQLEAWVGLPPAAALSLRVGQHVELTVAGKPLAAKVKSIGPDVQQSTRTRNVIFNLQLEERIVFPGQVVRLKLTENVETAGYWVPTAALTRGNRGLWSVHVVDGDMVARRDVEVLDTVGDRSFVRGTLQPGDEIVASGTHRVVVGQKVKREKNIAKNS